MFHKTYDPLQCLYVCLSVCNALHVILFFSLIAVKSEASPQQIYSVDVYTDNYLIKKFNQWDTKLRGTYKVEHPWC